MPAGGGGGDLIFRGRRGGRGLFEGRRGGVEIAAGGEDVGRAGPAFLRRGRDLCGGLRVAVAVVLDGDAGDERGEDKDEQADFAGSEVVKNEPEHGGAERWEDEGSGAGRPARNDGNFLKGWQRVPPPFSNAPCYLPQSKNFRVR
jgi:hypothetical protein